MSEEFLEYRDQARTVFRNIHALILFRDERNKDRTAGWVADEANRFADYALGQLDEAGLRVIGVGCAATHPDGYKCMLFGDHKDDHWYEDSGIPMELSWREERSQ